MTSKLVEYNILSANYSRHAVGNLWWCVTSFIWFVFCNVVFVPVQLTECIFAKKCFHCLLNMSITWFIFTFRYIEKWGGHSSHVRNHLLYPLAIWLLQSAGKIYRRYRWGWVSLQTPTDYIKIKQKYKNKTILIPVVKPHFLFIITRKYCRKARRNFRKHRAMPSQFASCAPNAQW